MGPQKKLRRGPRSEALDSGVEKLIPRMAGLAGVGNRGSTGVGGGGRGGWVYT